MSDFDEYLDTPGYGAVWIAAVLNLRKENGDLDIDKAYHVLASGYVDADKIGRLWTSTRRRLLGGTQGFHSRHNPKTESVTT
jgi:hypothetical protein